jgi:hypothetical protein
VLFLLDDFLFGLILIDSNLDKTILENFLQDGILCLARRVEQSIPKFLFIIFTNSEGVCFPDFLAPIPV